MNRRSRLRSADIHQIPGDTPDELDDDATLGASVKNNHLSTPHSSCFPSTYNNALPPPPTSPPVSSRPNSHPVHSAPPVSTCPTRETRPPTRYGNITTYAAVTKHVPDNDNPMYAQAMASPEKDHWRASMQVEFDSLVSHSVGRLIPRPQQANVLGGMWRFKRKRDKIQSKMGDTRQPPNTRH